MITYVLEEDGFEIISYRFVDVLGEVQTLQPDLILLNDWLREERRGRDYFRSLKANPRTCVIPVLLISTFTSIKAVVSNVGANGYITKPFDIDEVKPKIDAALKRSREYALEM